MYPSRIADRFQLRLPDGLRDRIRDAAASSRRSMNSEIILELERAFPAPAAATGAGFADTTPPLLLTRPALRMPVSFTPSIRSAENDKH